MHDPYEVLGVAKNASAKDIKSAFRRLAKKHHPDQNPDDPKAKERFSAANQAYEILGDERKKAAFDRGEIDAEGKQRFHGFDSANNDHFGGFRRQQGGSGTNYFEFRQSGPGSGSFDAGDIFSHIFGDAFGQRGGVGGHQDAGIGDSQQARLGADINVNLDVTIEEVATAPKVTAYFPDGRKMAVKLPGYVEDGQMIRLKGQGEQGLGGSGDALIKIRFHRHMRYRLEGRDLHVDLPVSLKDAVLGTKAAVETPTGRLSVRVPEWSSSDKVLRIKGRGLPEKAGGHGDLYAHVRVMLPEAGDPTLEELMRQSAD